MVKKRKVWPSSWFFTIGHDYIIFKGTKLLFVSLVLLVDVVDEDLFFKVRRFGHCSVDGFF